MHERRWRKEAVTESARRGRRAIVVGTLVGSFLLAMTGPAAAGEGAWNSAGLMSEARDGHTATLLANGKVLVAGGNDATAELYDPATNGWSPAASMGQERSEPAAILLPNGKVLVAGGDFGPNPPAYLASAELYDPATNTWTPTGSMAVARRHPTATLLMDGRILVVGGSN